MVERPAAPIRILASFAVEHGRPRRPADLSGLQRDLSSAARWLASRVTQDGGWLLGTPSPLLFLLTC
jgi:hypothetical protein